VHVQESVFMGIEGEK